MSNSSDKLEWEKNSLNIWVQSIRMISQSMASLSNHFYRKIVGIFTKRSCLSLKIPNTKLHCWPGIVLLKWKLFRTFARFCKLCPTSARWQHYIAIQNCFNGWIIDVDDLKTHKAGKFIKGNSSFFANQAK